MDARPNVLNKILPCTSFFVMYSHRFAGSVWSGGGLVGQKMDDSSDEYVQYHGIVPYNIKAGSDIIAQLDCCNMSENASGTTKHARVYCQYQFGSAGKFFSGMLVGDAVLIPVLDSSGIYVLKQVDVITISGVVGGDCIGIKVNRDADHADDTLVGDFWFAQPLRVKYTKDKIGIT